MQADIARDSSYVLADSLIKKSIDLAERNKEEKLLPKLYYLAGKIQVDGRWYDEAEGYFMLSVDRAKASEQEDLVSKYLVKLGENHLDKGEFDLGVEKALEGLAIAKKIKNDTLVGTSYAALAEMYRIQDQLDLALKHNQLFVEIARKLKDQNMIGRAYSNLSAVLGELGRNYQAIDSLKKGLSFIDSTNLFGKAKLTSNIGYCYRNLGKYEEALQLHREALRIKREAKMNSSIAYSMGAIGRAHLGLGNTDSAIFYTRKEYELASNYKIPFQIADGASHLSEAYEAAGDYQNAMKFLKIRQTIADSLYHAQVESNMLLYQQKFDLSQKEKEVNQLKSQQLLDQAVQQNIYIVLISLLIIAVLLVFIYRYYFIKNREMQKVAKLKLEAQELESKRDQEALQSFTKDLVQKNKAIRSLTDQLVSKENEIKQLQNSKNEELEELSEIRILTDEDWQRFKLLFDKVYPQFFSRLNVSDLNFTKGEKRLLALTRLDMENSQIADALGISTESVSKSRFRLKKKLEGSAINSIEELAYSF